MQASNCAFVHCIPNCGLIDSQALTLCSKNNEDWPPVHHSKSGMHCTQRSILWGHR